MWRAARSSSSSHQPVALTALLWFVGRLWWCAGGGGTTLLGGGRGLGVPTALFLRRLPLLEFSIVAVPVVVAAAFCLWLVVAGGGARDDHDSCCLSSTVHSTLFLFALSQLVFQSTTVAINKGSTIRNNARCFCFVLYARTYVVVTQIHIW